MPSYTLEERAKYVMAARKRIDALKTKLEGDDDGRRLTIDTGQATGYITCLLSTEVINEAQYVELATEIGDALQKRVELEKIRLPLVGQFKA